MKRRRDRAPDDEIKIFGLNAVLAVADFRVEDIIRVYLVEERTRELGKLLKWCAQNKRAYHVVDRDELDRVADSVHHEGVCILAKRRAPVSFTQLKKELERSRKSETIVLLEDVKNPHNIGAILRIAAHFGARALLLPDQTRAERPPPALIRTAEGGAESVDLVAIKNADDAIEDLRELGFRSIATSSHAKDSIWDLEIPRRALVLFGSEGDGLSDRAFDRADLIAVIPGTGAVESLNVASAAAIILGEIYRAHAHDKPLPQ
jgi:TrmH RNA methyltransferase